MTYRYQVGGSLASDEPSYVEREADAVLYEKLSAGELCHVFNSRQMGKSSLLVRTKGRLKAQGILCIALDLTVIGGTTATPTQWYKGLMLQLCMGCKALNPRQFKDWWQAQDDLPFIQRFSHFIEEVLFEHFPHRRIVILLDEIDVVISLPFATDELFAFIRFCFNQRSLDSRYECLTFGLFGVANPSKLIQNPRLTPFNIGYSIELKGFSEHQISPLSQGLAVLGEQAFDLLTEILEWTSGQPFLTQKLAKQLQEYVELLTQDSPEIPENLELGMPDLWLQGKSLEPLNRSEIQQLIAAIVQHHIIQNWESKDNPEHLATIRKRLLSNELTVGRLLGLYQSILMGEAIRYDSSSEQMELLLSGLVIHHQGILRVKNKIYQQIFNLDWINRHLEDLRPYSASFNAWLESGQSNPLHLLTGCALEQALTWSQNRQLSDLDYRFLGASQELAKQAVQQKLVEERRDRELAELTSQSLQAATQAFSQARQAAQVQARSFRVGWGWLAGVLAGVTGGILFMRAAGLLQGLEWMALDQLFQHRTGPTPDSPITLVTIDEPDIQAVGTYPLPDQVLAQTLAVLNSHGPRVIGLDIYRDLPMQPGHDALVEELRQSPHLVGIEKVIPPAVKPPPALQQTDQIGFVDQILDGDGTVRRTLLSISTEDEQGLHLSFPLQLTLKYLAKEGIQPQFLEGSQIQLGEALIRPFTTSKSGFYVGAEEAGYQMLLNYGGPQSQFQTLSLEAVLTRQFDPELVRDRLVIIGFIADSVNDFFISPYSNRLTGSAEPMAGVTIHANKVSQLLNAALHRRPLLRVWPLPLQWLWILFWPLLAGWWVGQRSSAIAKGIVVLLLTAVLWITAYWAFAVGWWIPVIPPLLSLWGVTLFLSNLAAKQSECWQLRQMTRSLQALAQTDPVVGQIALEYLKQIEGQDTAKRKQIEKWLSESVPAETHSVQSPFVQ